jgi:demethylmenaquinone methyltransferase/2-methoxy-6-polyprenyl-1,4-benzoquinol methylase
MRFGGFRVDEGVPSKLPARGAAPEGAQDSEQVSRAVREMFTAIAPRYDFLNHLLSANVDKLWWRRTAKAFATVLSKPRAQVLDLCCGTGDMAFALRKEAAGAHVTGADFSHAMLQLAAAKSHGNSPCWIEADAMRLPFPDQRFDLVTSAFGFRNLADYNAGLGEILRVLRSGGEVGILEFNEPRGFFGKLYNIYFKQVLPRVGRWISGDRGAYSYLPASVSRFPDPDDVMGRMRAAGFRDVSWTPYTFGIAGLFRGRR